MFLCGKLKPLFATFISPFFLMPHPLPACVTGQTLGFYIYKLANWAPALPGKHLMSSRHSSGHFRLHKVFSPMTSLHFRVWGAQGFRGWVGGVMLVLGTFPELVGRSVQNLVEIGLAVRMWKGYIGTNNHFYVNRCAKIELFSGKALVCWICQYITNIFFETLHGTCRLEVEIKQIISCQWSYTIGRLEPNVILNLCQR